MSPRHNEDGDDVDDISRDIGDDVGQWLTYGQIAAARNIKREAAIRLVQRHKWRRQSGNDGLMRVLVPPDWLKPMERQSSPDDAGDVARDVAPDVMGVREAIQAAIEAIREAKEGEIRVWRERTEVAEARAEAERSRADTLRERVATLEAAEAEAKRTIEDFKRAEAKRRAQGRLRRVLAAWRGR